MVARGRSDLLARDHRKLQKLGIDRPRTLKQVDGTFQRRCADFVESNGQTIL